MVAFPKPLFSYNYNAASQIEKLHDYRANKPGRQIPAKSENHLLIATWNIANLGVQERRPRDYQVIAELVSWFDMVALQEVNDNLSGLRSIQNYLPEHYHSLFSDYSGNNERLAFLYDTDKVSILEKVGEIAVAPSAHRYIKLPGIQQKYHGFDRNPYLVGFKCKEFTFVIVNVHLYFGSTSTKAVNRRSLEAYAVGRWADLRRKSQNAYSKDIIVLGDFNLPRVEAGDPIYEALSKRGLHIPEHSSTIGSTIATDNQYDQIAFFPGQTQQEFTGNHGIFDFDGPLFPHLWESRGREDFLAYMRYYISDHRIMWAEFQTTLG